jgi:hypothetical protein
VHYVSLIRLYDENDELDMEIVTSDPSLFSIVFSEPKLVHAVSIEPGGVPHDPSLSRGVPGLRRSAAEGHAGVNATANPPPRPRPANGRRKRRKAQTGKG